MIYASGATNLPLKPVSDEMTEEPTEVVASNIRQIEKLRPNRESHRLEIL